MSFREHTAERQARENPQDDFVELIDLPNRSFYVKLMIGDEPSRPFSGQTQSPS